MTTVTLESRDFWPVTPCNSRPWHSGGTPPSLWKEVKPGKNSVETCYASILKLQTSCFSETSGSALRACRHNPRHVHLVWCQRGLNRTPSVGVECLRGVWECKHDIRAVISRRESRTPLKNAVLWSVTPRGSCEIRRFGGSFATISRMMAARSSETFVLARATRRQLPEDCILHSHRRKDLKFWNLCNAFLAGFSCVVQACRWNTPSPQPCTVARGVT
jgi:hypothetical protein